MGAPIQNYATDNIQNVTELNDALLSANNGDELTSSANFDTSNFNITMPTVDVTINGNNVTSTKDKLTISGDGSGKLTIKNLTFDGTLFPRNLVTISNTKGPIIFDNVVLKNGKDGVMDISAQDTSQIVINNSLFDHNSSSNSGSAITLRTGNLTINNTTISNNIGTSAGYECGAIATKSYKGTLTINNSLFENNVNQCYNTSVVGGGGGALSMHYLEGNVSVNQSIFRGNKTNGGESMNTASTYDGGAIYVFDGKGGGSLNIDSSTFDSNFAYDDGGAIMIQATGFPGFKSTISNSTFINNTALGESGGNRSGGAIQFFKNGGLTSFNNSITGSTFYNNTAGGPKTNVEQRGGAVGLSGTSAFAMASASTSGNLFIGNNVFSNGSLSTASSYKDVSSTSTTDTGKNNIINVDGGATPQYSVSDLLGSNPRLRKNLTSITAGYNPELVMTLPIIPDSLADNNYKGSTSLGATDQRSLKRDKDLGAVSVTSLGYDANGGQLNISEITDYTGLEYTTLTDGLITRLYSIAYTDGSVNIYSGSSLKITRPGYIFKGWSRDKNATEPDPTITPGTDFILTDLTTIFYAVWEEVEHKLTYDGNGNTAGVAPTDSNTYQTGQKATLLGKNSLVRDGYTFKGWSLVKDDANNTLAEGSDYIMNLDTTLFAVWEKDIDPIVEFKLTYDGNGNTAGVAPIDNNTYQAGQKATLLGKGGLVRSGYSFKGWSLVKDDTANILTEGSLYEMNADTKLFAVWEKDIAPVEKYTLTYHGNGNTSGSAPVDNKTYQSGQKAALLGKGDLHRKGYTFKGWSPLKDDNSHVLPEGNLYTITKNTTLYAVWEKDIDPIVEFKLTYDGNSNTSGNAPIDNKLYQAGQKATLLGKGDLLREGYTFKGWSIIKDDDSKILTEGSLYTMTENITFYAVWEKDIDPIVEFKLTYNGNGNTSGTAPVDKNLYQSGQKATLLGKNDLYRKGYTFKGWSLVKDDESNILAEGALYSITEDTTLYAVWKEDKDSVIPPTGVAHSNNGLIMVGVGAVALALSLIVKRKRNK